MSSIWWALLMFALASLNFGIFIRLPSNGFEILNLMAGFFALCAGIWHLNNAKEEHKIN